MGAQQRKECSRKYFSSEDIQNIEAENSVFWISFLWNPNIFCLRRWGPLNAAWNTSCLILLLVFEKHLESRLDYVPGEERRNA